MMMWLSYRYDLNISSAPTTTATITTTHYTSPLLLWPSTLPHIIHLHRHCYCYHNEYNRSRATVTRWIYFIIMGIQFNFVICHGYYRLGTFKENINLAFCLLKISFIVVISIAIFNFMLQGKLFVNSHAGTKKVDSITSRKICNFNFLITCTCHA